MQSQNYILTQFIEADYNNFWVPPYQRNYKWGKEEVNELIDDIEKFQKNTNLNKFFLGTIVIKRRDKNDSRFTLVDGQQRITTIFLMCSAYRDILKSKNLILDSKTEDILKSTKEKFKLMRINDEKVIEKIMKGNFTYLNDEERKSNYFNIYKYLKDEFNKMIDKEQDLKKLKNFFEKGIYHMDVCIITLDPEEDEYFVFESLNSKGQNLTSADAIKNHIMLSLKDEELQDKFENGFITKAKESELEQLYRQTIAIESGDLYSLKGKDLSVGFKKLWPNHKINKSFINNMFYDLAIFKWITNLKNWNNKTLPLIKSESKGKLMKFYSMIHLTVKKNSNFINNELEILNHHKKNIKFVADYLCKYMIARMLSGSAIEPNKDFARLTFSLKKELNEHYQEKFINIFRKKIIEELNNTNNTYKMPKQSSIQETSLEGYIPLHNPIIKWILIAIEQNMRKLDLFNPEAKITVEHIFPKNPKSNWEKELGKEQVLRMKREQLYALGNLSITYINSPLGNATAEQKKKILKERSYLKINKWFYEEDIWNYDAIKKRTLKLLEEIFKIWWN